MLMLPTFLQLLTFLLLQTLLHASGPLPYLFAEHLLWMACLFLAIVLLSVFLLLLASLSFLAFLLLLVFLLLLAFL
jgi:hypothetical protein